MTTEPLEEAQIRQVDFVVRGSGRVLNVSSTACLMGSPLQAVSLAFAIALFWWTLDPRARTAGLALLMFGLLGLNIDSFSKERADIDYARILAALTEQS